MYKIINRKKYWATVVADLLGRLLTLPVRFFRKPCEIRPQQVESILVIRTAYIGDVVMTLPLLKPLRHRFPNAKITFLTASSAKPVLDNNPYVDEVVTYNPFWFYPVPKGEYLPFIGQFRKKSFDLVIEARADIRELLMLVAPLKSPHKVSYGVGGGGYLLDHLVAYDHAKPHKVDYHLEIGHSLGCEPEPVEWGIYPTPQEEKELKLLMEQHNITPPFLAAHPGSRLALKRWSEERCARAYDRLIKDHGMDLLLFGTNQEQEIIDRVAGAMQHPPINLCGKVNLRQMALLVGKAALFICNDSAPMHLAAAMNTPTVAIFGPSKSWETGPYQVRHRVVEKEYPCRVTCDENSCSHERYNGCMEAILVEDVVDAAKSLLQVEEQSTSTCKIDKN